MQAKHPSPSYYCSFTFFILPNYVYWTLRAFHIWKELISVRCYLLSCEFNNHFILFWMFLPDRVQKYFTTTMKKIRTNAKPCKLYWERDDKLINVNWLWIQGKETTLGLFTQWAKLYEDQKQCIQRYMSCVMRLNIK